MENGNASRHSDTGIDVGAAKGAALEDQKSATRDLQAAASEGERGEAGFEVVGSAARCVPPAMEHDVGEGGVPADVVGDDDATKKETCNDIFFAEA